MNWQHFQTFFWLRWRLRVNQLKRGGFANKVLLALLAVGCVFLAAGLFVASFVIGLLALREASAVTIQFVWDGVVLAFLFIWFAGLLSDLQRSEVLSLDKFLHLPVSLSGAFIVNYLSSLFSLTLLVFVPAMVGLSLGLAVGRGAAMLLLLPAVAALLLMVTAVTHQFQGWLASLMVNKRRRRTIIVGVTMAFVLLSQLPSLFSQLSISDNGSRVQALMDAQNELYRASSVGEITRPVYDQRLEKLRSDYFAKTEEISRQKWERVERVTSLASLFLPPAWLPLGAMAAAQGQVWPALLGTLGMTLLGSVSLWRSYRTTLRLYTGQLTSGRPRPAAPATLNAPSKPPSKVAPPPVSHLLERQLPWLPEQASAVALSSFRALMRAPEVKMMLLSPLFVMVVLGPAIMRGKGLPEAARPLLGFGAMAFVLLMMVGLVGNQFGFDRSGFQVFMLSGVRRQDILLGKNAAVAPLALGMALATAIVVQIIVPMRFIYFLAVPVELVSMYLMFCLLANWLSIRAPANVPAGALRRAKPSGATIVLHMLSMFVFFPLAMVPMTLPLGIQVLLEDQGWVANVPVCLLLSLVECAVVVYLYRLVLRWEGRLLQAREQAIYAIVRTKEE